MLVALTRGVPASIGRCELTHLERVPIDVNEAVRQHAAYESALQAAGCQVVRLPPEPELPDSVFVEDTAVVLAEVAIVTRPGVESRRGETASIGPVLARYRAVQAIGAPGTLDGGDVLVAGRTIYVGVGGRTNAEGVRQLAGIAGAFGYSVVGVEARGCLHLKTAATLVSPAAVLLNPSWVDRGVFAGLEWIAIDPREPFGANGLLIGDRVLCGAAFPRTRDLLLARGISTVAVDLGELAKAEGAVTCCSVVVSGAGPPRQTDAGRMGW